MNLMMQFAACSWRATFPFEKGGSRGILVRYRSAMTLRPSFRYSQPPFAKEGKVCGATVKAKTPVLACIVAIKHARNRANARVC